MPPCNRHAPKNRSTWPPTLSHFQELEKKAAAYDKLLTKQAIHEFAHAFGSALATLAAATPMSDWPDEFLTAFNHVAAAHPSASQLYATNLPLYRDRTSADNKKVG